jgi:hypothetical protein
MWEQHTAHCEHNKFKFPSAVSQITLSRLFKQQLQHFNWTPGTLSPFASLTRISLFLIPHLYRQLCPPGGSLAIFILGLPGHLCLSVFLSTKSQYAYSLEIASFTFASFFTCCFFSSLVLLLTVTVHCQCIWHFSITLT